MTSLHLSAPEDGAPTVLSPQATCIDFSVGHAATVLPWPRTAMSPFPPRMTPDGAPTIIRCVEDISARMAAVAEYQAGHIPGVRIQRFGKGLDTLAGRPLKTLRFSIYRNPNEKICMSSLKDFLAQRSELEKQIEQMQSGARNEAIAQIRALMADHGLTVADVVAKPAGGKSKTSQTKGTTVAAKYRNDATGETWTGRGLKPNWLKAQIAAGRTLEDFAV